ncbi:MAG: bifunctional nuclease family protein [Bacteroidales bacterium]|nr:bifunctional nuclease family protein [Bacteroidales bacterium]
MRKIKLNVLGISYSQTQSGAYALVLSEEDGEKRLPIIIGGFEAQSIVIKLENLNPPRPLTHDLFKSFADLLDVKMREVFIHKLEEGVFYSQLVCTKDDKELLIDSRTSDAVALALRFECPVYITEEIMDKAGIIIKGDEAEEMLGGRGTGGIESAEDDSLSSFSLAELTNMLQEAIESEDYERAAAIRDEIGKKEKK